VNNSGFKAVSAEFFPFPCVKTRKSARLLHFSRTREQKNQRITLELASLVQEIWRNVQQKE
jgi:hypothetical protein